MYQICRENVHSSDGTNDDGAGTRASGEAATILQLRPCARHGDVASSLATNFHIRYGFKLQNNLKFIHVKIHHCTEKLWYP